MIEGSFGDNGELFFEIEVVASSREKFSVKALFDTGFTDWFLAINSQDLDAFDNFFYFFYFQALSEKL